MNKEVQIVISARDAASQAFRGLTGTITGFSKTAKSQIDRVTRSVNQIADSARALAMPLSIASGAAIAMGDRFVDLAFKAETGTKLFNKMLNRVGENQKQVAEQVLKLSDALRIPPEIIEQNAKDLLRKGFTFAQIADIYEGAVASGLTIGKDTIGSIQSVNEALVSEMSIQLNRIGIAENLSTAYQDYAESLGKTKDQLTDTEKAAAAHLMIQKATAAEVEDLPELFKGYGGAVASLGEEWYKTQRIIGDEAMPMWTRVKQGAADLLSTFNNLDDKQRDIIFGIGKVAGKAVMAAAGIGLMASAASLAGKVFGILSGVASLLTTPLILGGVGLAALGVTLYTAWDNNWGGIRDTVTQVWDESLKPALESMWDWTTKAWEWTINVAGDAWDWITNTTWEEKWQDIKTWMSQGWTWFIGIAGTAWDWLKNIDWKSNWDIIKEWMSTGWDWVINIAGDAWDWLEKKAPKLTGGLETAWDWSVGTIDSFLIWVKDTAWPWINSTISTAWEWTANAGNVLFAWIKDTAWPWLSKTASTAWSWSVEAGNDLFTWIKDTAWPWIKDGASTVWKWTVEGADTNAPFAVKVVDATIKWSMDYAENVGENIKTGLETGDWSGLIKNIRNAGQVALGVTFASTTISAFASSIGRKLATQPGFAAVTGTSAIAAVTLGLKIAEEIAAGENIMDDILNALGGAAMGFVLGGPWGAGIGMTIAVEFEVFSGATKKIHDLLKPARELLGTEPNFDYYNNAINNNPVEQGTIENVSPTILDDFINTYKGSMWYEPYYEFLQSIFGGNFASGGKVSGPGSGTSDSIVARISNGEYIVNAQATKRWLPLLEAINNGELPAFAGGGLSGIIPNLTGNFDLDFANVSEFIGQMADNMNKMISSIVLVITKSFEFIGKLLIDIAKKIFGEENVNQAISIYEEFKAAIADIFADKDTSSSSGGNKTAKEPGVFIPTGAGREIPGDNTMISSWNKLLFNIGMRFDAATIKLSSFWGNAVENLSGWMKKSWDDKLVDMKNLFADMIFSASNIFKGAANALVNQSPILSGMVDTEGGIIQGLKSPQEMLMNLVMHSKVFAKILEAVNPVLQALADVAGAVLLPVLKIVEPPLKALAKVLEWAANLIVNIWNGLMNVLDGALGWIHDFDQYKASLSDLTDETAKATKAMSDFNKVAGFKTNLRSFQVAQGRPSASQLAATGSGGESVQVHLHGNYYGMRDFEKAVADAWDKIKTKRNLRTNGIS